MRGLILKDILNMKSYVKILVLVFAAQAFIFIPKGDVSFLSGFIILLCTMMVITTISYDHLAKWDKYALTMPITRKEIVLSKYVIFIVFSISGAIIGNIFTLVGGYFIKSINVVEAMIGSVSILAVDLILGSIILPLLYKFGPEKARLLIILVTLIPTGLIMLGSQLFKNLGLSAPSVDVIKNLIFAIPVLAIICVIISYFVSLKIYSKKDF